MRAKRVAFSDQEAADLCFDHLCVERVFIRFKGQDQPCLIEIIRPRVLLKLFHIAVGVILISQLSQMLPIVILPKPHIQAFEIRRPDNYLAVKDRKFQPVRNVIPQQRIGNQYLRF